MTYRLISIIRNGYCSALVLVTVLKSRFVFFCFGGSTSAERCMMGDEYTGFLTVENDRKPYTRKSNARRGQERATPRKVPMKREPYEYLSSESKDGV
jgi:hypothetical protein